ncbi:hypothetical protein [Saccharopolyspora pogona]|uniref:hypothetical protein n=1 Tax=Saccharopolyspora pogona TaxID=333966 RepID=UPI001687B864|nr:hypothetical protein [Saccharopolyspora pogona]
MAVLEGGDGLAKVWKTVLARFVHNDRLVDALHQRAFCALRASPGLRVNGHRLRDRGPVRVRPGA